MARTKAGKAKSRATGDRKVPGSKVGTDSKIGWEDIRYFKPREFTCNCDDFCDHSPAISLELVAKLDRIRDAIEMPVKINSGTRCERHNRRVGGDIHSAHVPKKRKGRATDVNQNGTSHAADVHCPNATFRYAFLSAALPLFNRIGIAKDFIHVDDAPELPDNAIWVY